MEEVIVKLYAEVLLAVLFTIGYLVLLVQKRQWIHLGKVAPSKRQSLRKIEKRVDCVVKVVGGICVIVMVVWRVIPGILDFLTLWQETMNIQPVRLLFGIIAEKPENKQEALKCLIHIPMKKYM